MTPDELEAIERAAQKIADELPDLTEAQKDALRGIFRPPAQPEDAAS